MKVLDIKESLPIKDPVIFARKLLELIEGRSEAIDSMTVAIRLKDGHFSVSSSSDNSAEALWEFSCASNALIIGKTIPLPEVMRNEI